MIILASPESEYEDRLLGLEGPYAELISRRWSGEWLGGYLRGNAEEAQRLLRHLQEEHMDEPGVAQKLMEMLVAAGVVGPDGSPAGPPPAGGPGLAVQPNQPSKLWTPDDAAPSEAKGKIWTPG